MFPSRGARVSVEILILAGSPWMGPRGWGPRETRPPAGSGSPITFPSPCILTLRSPFVLYRSPARRSYGGGDSSTGPYITGYCRLNPFPSERTAIQHSRVMLLKPGDPREWLRGTNFCRPAGNLRERPRAPLDRLRLMILQRINVTVNQGDNVNSIADQMDLNDLFGIGEKRSTRCLKWNLLWNTSRIVRRSLSVSL